MVLYRIGNQVNRPIESNFRAFQNLVSEHSVKGVPASLYNLTKSVPDPLYLFNCNLLVTIEGREGVSSAIFTLYPVLTSSLKSLAMAFTSKSVIHCPSVIDEHNGKYNDVTIHDQ